MPVALPHRAGFDRDRNRVSIVSNHKSEMPTIGNLLRLSCQYMGLKFAVNHRRWLSRQPNPRLRSTHTMNPPPAADRLVPTSWFTPPGNGLLFRSFLRLPWHACHVRLEKVRCGWVATLFMGIAVSLVPRPQPQARTSTRSRRQRYSDKDSINVNGTKSEKLFSG